MKVAIIEDDPGIRILIEEVVSERYPVVSFETAEYAWPALLEDPPELILIDRLLPGVDGLELCRRVRQMPWGRECVLVIMTALSTSDSLGAAIEAGADDFLAKPFTIELLEIRLAIAERQVAVKRERSVAERALQHRESRFRALSEHATDLISVIDAEGIVRYASRSYESILGYDPREVVGQSVLVGVHREDVRRIERLLEALSGNAGPRSESYRMRHRNGTWRTMEMIAVNALDDPAVEGIVATTRDITAHVQSQEAVRASERFTRATLDALADEIVILDKQGTILAVNGAWRQFARDNGWFASQAGVGLNYLGICDAAGNKDALEAAHGIRAVLETQLPSFSMEYECHTLLAQRWFRLQVTRFSGEGPLHVVVTHQEVTVQKQSSSQIERHVARLSALRAIDLAITSSLDLQVTLQVVVSEVVSQLQVDACVIRLLDQTQQSLEYAASIGLHSTERLSGSIRLGEGPAGSAALERRRVQLNSLELSRLAADGAPAFPEEGVKFYVGVPLIVKGAVHGVLEIYHGSEVAPDRDWLDILDTFAGQTAIAIDNASLYEGLQRSNSELVLAYDTTIEGWAHALDLRDKETEGHSRRVTELTIVLARALGIPEAELAHVRRGALLHDIGKMGIPDAILLKNGPLTDEEWVIMRKHPVYSYELLTSIAYLRPALDVPYCHHEKWDGTGYPRGLSGNEIPLAARVFSVVDVWDALTSNRPYRAAWSPARAREYIAAQAGLHFDPRVVEGFLALPGFGDGEGAKPLPHPF